MALHIHERADLPSRSLCTWIAPAMDRPGPVLAHPAPALIWPADNSTGSRRGRGRVLQSDHPRRGRAGSVPTVFFITHPDVAIDPGVPIPEWPLDERGRARMRAITAQRWARGLRAFSLAASAKLATAHKFLRRLLATTATASLRNSARMIGRRRVSLPKTNSKRLLMRSSRTREKAFEAGSRPSSRRRGLCARLNRSCCKPRQSPT